MLFVTASALVAALAKAHARTRLEERSGFYAKPPADRRRTRLSAVRANEARLCFQLVSRRYERGSVLITARPPNCCNV